MDLSRRDFIQGTLLGSAALSLPTGCSVAGSAAQQDSGPTLWYRQPAAEWNEALPVGNGRLGAMVFGGAVYRGRGFAGEFGHARFARGEH